MNISYSCTIAHRLRGQKNLTNSSTIGFNNAIQSTMYVQSTGYILETS